MQEHIKVEVHTERDAIYFNVEDEDDDDDDYYSKHTYDHHYSSSGEESTWGRMVRCMSIFNIFSTVVRITIPGYLSRLPIPDSLCGWLALGIIDWIRLIPLILLCTGIGYVMRHTYRRLIGPKPGIVNYQIKKKLPIVISTVPVDSHNVMKQLSFCRCWKSSMFPYCDGLAHGKHNSDTGDNVGPLVILPKGEKSAFEKAKSAFEEFQESTSIN